MENLFFQPEIANGVFCLNPDESRHCLKVLRKKQGDSITLTDGAGYFYEALILEANTRQCTFAVQKKWAEPKRNYRIHLAISPTKNPDRIEWMVEKCVEIGIDQITFINCDHTERHRLKAERISKVAVSAMKQSVRATLPFLNPLITFQEFVTSSLEATKFMAYIDPNNPAHLKSSAYPGQHYVILVGPEGDFTKEEITLALQHGFKKISLGNHRLRTETAGLVACQILNLVNC